MFTNEATPFYSEKSSNEKFQDPLFHSPEIKKRSKRLSINHFKIESSINEEIKEERSSKSTSEKSQHAENLIQEPPLVHTIESPKFTSSQNASHDNQQHFRMFVATQEQSQPKGTNFELSEASKNTVEKDEDEIGSHLKHRRADLVPNIAIKNQAKMNPSDQQS